MAFQATDLNMQDFKEIFLRKCIQGIKAKGLMNQKAQDRLAAEIWEIDAQGEYEYFLDLERQGTKFTTNEHNLLVAYLLDLAPSVDLDKEPTCVTGEFPDVDVDIHPVVREYIRNEWIPKTFGEENVCAIGTLGTFGIKGAIKDVARIFDLDHMEINAITTEFEDKDDEGQPITWETACKLYPQFKAYVEAHPEVAEATQKLLNRNRSLGKHAGGMIIANQRIDNIIPLMKGGEDKSMVSAFTEGLHGTDLGPLGLVKFDFLSLVDLYRVVVATNMVKERYGLRALCAKGDGPSWSDTSYLNDPKALAMANAADLKGIFQFGSPGIRKMVKEGGVDCFDDLAVYNALYRPGPLNCLRQNTLITTVVGKKKISDLINWHDEIYYLNNTGNICSTKKYFVFKTGLKRMVRVKTKSGKYIECSLDHKFLSQGMKFIEAKKLKIGDKIAVRNTT